MIETQSSGYNLWNLIIRYDKALHNSNWLSFFKSGRILNYFFHAKAGKWRWS